MTRSARRGFTAASTAPMWLGEDDLHRLQHVFPPVAGTGHVFPPPPGFGYDLASLEKRGRERAKVLRSLLPTSDFGSATAELGCGDGMVSAMLKRAGADATAIDLSPRLFDDRARRDGVRFIEADVTQLPFHDGTFDLVFSFNAFEHFPRPDVAFAEALRVTRVGGLIYLSFGPLYMSAYGPHAANSIKVPYAHYLFTRDVLDRYVTEQGLRAIPHDSTNKWTLPQFRSLWASHDAQVERLVYREIPEIHGVELLVRNPQCFRSKTDLFDNMIVGTIEAAFRKVHA